MFRKIKIRPSHSCIRWASRSCRGRIKEDMDWVMQNGSFRFRLVYISPVIGKNQPWLKYMLPPNICLFDSMNSKKNMLHLGSIRVKYQFLTLQFLESWFFLQKHLAPKSNGSKWTIDPYPYVCYLGKFSKGHFSLLPVAPKSHTLQSWLSATIYHGIMIP